MKKFVVVGVLAAGLAACGGGGSDIFSSDDNNQGGLPPERPQSSVSGYSVDALITGGMVKVYALDSMANKAGLLGSGVTDSAGFYEITLQASSQPVLIEVTSGSYIEEASGVSVTLSGGDSLKAVTFYESGEPLTTMVTPFTNLAAGIVKNKVENGINLNNAITEAATAISTITGVDILTTYPRNITDPANAAFALTDEHLYGFLTAAQSLLTKDISEKNGVPAHTIYTSMGLSQVMYQDVAGDGLLDGMGVNSAGDSIQLAMGTVPLDANLYRNVLAENMLSVAADTSVNKTEISMSDLIISAQAIASNGHAMFAGIEAAPLDQEPPSIAFTEAEGLTKAGVFDFSVAVSDFIGVESVEFFIDGSSIGIAASLDAPGIAINSLEYDDGEHVIGVLAKDIIGNISEMVEFTVSFDNTGATAVVTSPLLTNQALYDISGTWHDDGVGASSIVVAGREAAINDDGTWFVTVTLEPGYNDIDIITTDNLGNSKESMLTIGLDQAPPSITAIHDTSVNYAVDETTIYVDTFAFADSKTYPVRVYTDELSSNGVSPCNYPNAGITYLDFTGLDPYFFGVRTAQKDLKYEIRYLRDDSVVYDWRLLPPCIEGSTGHTFGLTTEYLDDEWHLFPNTTEHKIEVRVIDEVGNFSEFDHRFRVDVRVPNDALVLNNVSGSYDLSGVNFSARMTLFNSDLHANTYEVTNDSNHDVFASFTDINTHKVTNTVDWAQREHQYNLVTSPEWKARYYKGMDIFGGTCEQWYSDWSQISSYYQWYADGSTQLIQRPSNSEGEILTIQSDTLPLHPMADPWADVPPPSSSYNLVGLFGNNHLFYRGLNNEVNVGLAGQNITFNFTHGDSCQTGFQNNFKERNVYTYVSKPGFPRTNSGDFEISSDAFNSQIDVVDIDGNKIAGLDGYYKLRAGERYFIKRYISTPNITSYNDISVASIGSFGSYFRKQYDRKIEWDIDRELAVNLVHAETPGNLYGLTHSRVVHEEGKKDFYTISR